MFDWSEIFLVWVFGVEFDVWALGLDQSLDALPLGRGSAVKIQPHQILERQPLGHFR
jgi:hypothetical protein